MVLYSEIRKYELIQYSYEVNWMEKQIILIVDDVKSIRDMIQIYLIEEGYEVLTAADGIEALQVLDKHNVALVVLDVMMPNLDGIQTCLRIRSGPVPNLPIIMLSAKTEDTDKIVGLHMGADDYVTKPFNPMELIARIKSQLRRYGALTRKPEQLHSSAVIDKNSICIDELEINELKHSVTVGGHPITLTPREFDILILLSRNKGIVFSMQKIYETVWNEDFIATDTTIAVHIRNLRTKLEEYSNGQKYIKTVWGVGYKIGD